jgi:NAD(P)-dependent dehydrogenase (short-subunit alcohol dehydrogenase family)
MAKKLADKVALVTGASKGIGASIAKHLAAEGAAVVVNYASSKEGADRVVGEIVGNGEGPWRCGQTSQNKLRSSVSCRSEEGIRQTRYPGQQRRCL